VSSVPCETKNFKHKQQLMQELEEEQEQQHQRQPSALRRIMLSEEQRLEEEEEVVVVEVEVGVISVVYLEEEEQVEGEFLAHNRLHSSLALEVEALVVSIVQQATWQVDFQKERLTRTRARVSAEEQLVLQACGVAIVCRLEG